MRSYKQPLEDIIEMQRWAAANPVHHDKLLIKLYQVRAELERLAVLGTLTEPPAR